MKKYIILFLLFFVFSSGLFSQVVINEVMYAPVSPAKEWFEIYNKGTSPVNLQNWKWKDLATSNPVRTITSQSIILPPNTFAIVCEDSANLKSSFPNITGIILQSNGWNALNNTGNESIMIYDASGVTIDTLGYTNSWGGSSGGFSLERISVNQPTNLQSNWGTSQDGLKATPNRTNSITAKDYDVALKSFDIIPTTVQLGENVSFRFVLKNLGLNIANNVTLGIYKDINGDSIAQPSELIKSELFSSINVSDSVNYDYTYNVSDSTVKQFIGQISFAQDLDTNNNKLIRRINIGDKLVINEIMYDPLTGNAEWVELYNPLSKSVNISGWKFNESSTNVSISDSINYMLDAGAYIVIASDTTVYNRFPELRTLSQGNRLIIKSISLTNDGETLKIVDASGNTIEEVTYSPKWHNPNIADEKGYSLERINPLLNGNNSSNWSSSADFLGGTPARKNSIYTPVPVSTGTITVSPNPFSPDGDGFEDFTIITYQTTQKISQLRLKIYDAKGRLVRTLANNQLSGSKGEVIFNGLNDNGEKLRLGIYVIFLEAVDDRGGTVETLKSPVVIATKL